MNCGIYHGIPAKEYHTLPFASNSYLKRLAKCPANAKVEQEDDTKALILGRGAHLITLEGEAAYREEFCILPEDAPRKPTSRQIEAKKPSIETLYACDWWQQFSLMANGKQTISAEDHATLVGVSQAVHAHPFASKLLAQGVSETTVIFDREVCGETIRCKCRPDRTPAVQMRTLIDLKTCEDASYDGFLRSCLKWGYVTQAAFYLDGYNSQRPDGDEEMDTFCFIAAEKKPPYRVEVYTLDADFVAWGRGEYMRLLAIERQCRNAGSWPAYQNAGADELLMPAWLR